MVIDSGRSPARKSTSGTHLSGGGQHWWLERRVSIDADVFSLVLGNKAGLSLRNAVWAAEGIWSSS